MKPIFTGSIDNLFHFLRNNLYPLHYATDSTTSDIIIEYLINYMEKNFESYNATVTDKKTKEEKLRLDRRISAKKTNRDGFFTMNIIWATQQKHLLN